MKRIAIKAISVVLLLAFFTNTACYGLATLPASQNPIAKREIEAALQRTQIRYAESEDALRLLTANNASCLLLSSGKYLVTKEIAQDDLRLLRAIIHEDIEAIMQIIAKEDRYKYQGIKELVLKLFPPSKNNKLPIDLYVNHTVARALEWLVLLENGTILKDEIPQQELSFINTIRPIIMANKHNYFTAEFWDSSQRSKVIRNAINRGMVFYQVASAEKNSKNTELCVRFTDPNAQDIDLVGGKGASLAELAQINGINVPEGFVLTTNVFDMVVQRNNIEPFIKQLDDLSVIWARYKVEDRPETDYEMIVLKKKINDLTSMIQKKIREGEVPDEINEIMTRLIIELENTGGAEMVFAVRSSATAEDMPYASFAGQHDTLFVKKDKLIEAMRECWASLYNPRAVDYRNEQRILMIKEGLRENKDFAKLLQETPLRHPTVKLALVIQRMIQANVSGVGFNVIKGKGDPGFYIEALYGMGEALVQGMATPDKWAISPDGSIINVKKKGEKQIKLLYDIEKSSLNFVKLVTDTAEREKYCLEDNQVKLIANLIARIAAYYKEKHGYQYIDTEFVLDNRGNIYFVQARPETVHAKAVGNPQESIIKHDNIVVSYHERTRELRQAIIGQRSVEDDKELLEILQLEEIADTARNEVRSRSQLVNDSCLDITQPAVYFMLKCALIFQELKKNKITPNGNYLAFIADKATSQWIEKEQQNMNFTVDDPLNLFKGLSDEINHVLEQADNATIADIAYLLRGIESPQGERILNNFMQLLISRVATIDLVTIEKDDKLRGAAASILVAMRALKSTEYESAVRQLENKLCAGSLGEQIWSARVIEASRISDPNIIKLLFRRLRDTETDETPNIYKLRGMLANAISTNRNKETDDQAINILIEELARDQSYEIRFRAARGLRRFLHILKQDSSRINRLVEILRNEWRAIKDLDSAKNNVSGDDEKNQIVTKQKELEHVIFFTIILLGDLKAREAMPILEDIAKSPAPPSFLTQADQLNAKAREIMVLIGAEEVQDSMEHIFGQTTSGYYRPTGFYDGVNPFFSRVIHTLAQKGQEFEPDRKRREVFGNLVFYSREDERALLTIPDEKIYSKDLESSLFLMLHAPTQRLSYRGPCFSAPALHLPIRDKNFATTESGFRQYVGSNFVVTKACGMNFGSYGFGLKLHHIYSHMDGREDLPPDEQYTYVGTAVTLFTYDIEKHSISNIRTLSKEEALAFNYLLKHENLLAIFLRMCAKCPSINQNTVKENIEKIKTEGFFTSYLKEHYPFAELFSPQINEVIYHNGFTPYKILEMLKDLYSNTNPNIIINGENWGIFIPFSTDVSNIHRRHMELAHLRNAFTISSTVPDYLNGIFITYSLNDRAKPVIKESIYRDGSNIKENTVSFTEYTERFIPDRNRTVFTTTQVIPFSNFVASCALGGKIIKVTEDLKGNGIFIIEKDGIKYVIYPSEKEYEYFSEPSYKTGDQLFDISDDHIIGKGHSVGRIIKVDKIDESLLKRSDFSPYEPVIIVTKNTDPDSIPVIMNMNIVGLITEEGGKTSHPALVAHEYGIPALIGVGMGRFEKLKDGMNILLDLERRGRVVEVYDVQRRDKYVPLEEHNEEILASGVAFSDFREATPAEMIKGRKEYIVNLYHDAQSIGVVPQRHQQSDLCWNVIEEKIREGMGFSPLLDKHVLFDDQGNFLPRYGVSEVCFVPRDSFIYHVGRTMQEKLKVTVPQAVKTGENLHITVLGLQTGQSEPVGKEDISRILQAQTLISPIPSDSYAAVTGIYIDPNGAISMEVTPLPVEGKDVLVERQKAWRDKLATAKKSASPFHITLGMLYRPLAKEELSQLYAMIAPFRNRLIGIVRMNEPSLVHHHDNLLNNFRKVSNESQDDILNQSPTPREERMGNDSLERIIKDSRTILDLKQNSERWHPRNDGSYTNGFAIFNPNDRLIFDGGHVTIIYSEIKHSLAIYFMAGSRIGSINLALDDAHKTYDVNLTNMQGIRSQEINALICDARIDVKYPALYHDVQWAFEHYLARRHGLITIDIGGSYIKAGMVLLDDELRPFSLINFKKEKTPKVNKAAFYQYIARVIQDIKREVENTSPNISVLPAVSISMVGTFESRGGKAYILPNSAQCFGLRPDEFDNSCPSEELSPYLNDMTIIAENDSLSQFYHGVYSKLDDKRPDKIAFIGIGTGLGSVFGGFDSNGHLRVHKNLMVNNIYLNPEHPDMPERTIFHFRSTALQVSLSSISQKILSGRGVVRVLNAINKVAKEAGLGELFGPGCDAQTLNDILNNKNHPLHELAIQIAEYFGDILGKIICLIHKGDICRTADYSAWSEADKNSVKGTTTYLIGGSIGIKGELANIIQSRAKRYVTDRLGISINLISLVTDPDRASLLGAVNLIDKDTLRKMRASVVLNEVMSLPAIAKWSNHLEQIEQILQGKSASTIPLTVHFTPSLACNLNCLTCSQGASRMSHILNRGERGSINSVLMSRDNMMKFIEELYASGVKEIIFTGAGEPLTNPHTVEGMKHAKELGMRVGLLTNGVLLNKEVAEQIISIKPSFVRFSFDAGSPEIYRLFHGLSDDNAFQAVVTNFEYLVRRNLENGCPIEVSANVVITPLNIYDCANVARLMKEIQDRYPGGIHRLSFKPMINYESGRWNSQLCDRALNYVKDNPQLRRFYDIYHDLFYTDRQLPQWFFDEAVDIIESEAVPILTGSGIKYSIDELRMKGISTVKKPFDKCYACSLLTFIAPNGTVYHCPELSLNDEFSYGTMAKNSFAEIWNGEQRKNVIHQLNGSRLKNCFLPACCLFEDNETLQRINDALMRNHITLRELIDAIKSRNTDLTRKSSSGISYDSENARILCLDLIYAQLQSDRVYEIKYDTSRLTSSQIDILETYVGLLKARCSNPENIKLRPFSSTNGSKESLIAVYCTGKGFKGEGHVDVSIPEGELKDYLLRISGMVNIALASANIPDNLSKEDIDKYRPILSYINNQYKAILGEALAIPDSPEDILKVIRRIVLGLPKAMRKNFEQIEEYNRLAKEALTAA